MKGVIILMKLQPINNPLNGEIEIPGDKSISHRAVILGSLASGMTKVTNFLTSEDCLHTIQAFKSLGVSISREDTSLIIKSDGYNAFQEPLTPLYFGNSGTTARLMLGILAGIPFYSTIYGDPFLTERPMDRVIIPLKEMGVNVDGRKDGNFLPLSIRGGDLQGIQYTLPVKSAQVKSAILLAGLLAQGTTTITELTKTRTHTENMLQAFNADIQVDGLDITITNKQELVATDVHVPGDISSAAFFLVAAAIVPGSSLTLKNVGLNESRAGIIDVLQAMGANIKQTNIHEIGGELIGDLTITYEKLQSTRIEGEIIPRLIDEIPIIALLATQATGTTVIKDAEELRVKETDRIEAVVDILSKLGATITATNDGMIIEGNATLQGASVSAYNDHRMAMMIGIASLITKDTVTLDDASSINISYPNFFEDLQSIITK